MITIIITAKNIPFVLPQCLAQTRGFSSLKKHQYIFKNASSYVKMLARYAIKF